MYFINKQVDNHNFKDIMTIKKGDRVKFLNDTGGGVVKEIKDSKLAVVLIDDGFEVPVLISELIPAGGSAGNGNRQDKESSPTGRMTENKSGEDRSDDRFSGVTGWDEGGDDIDEDPDSFPDAGEMSTAEEQSEVTENSGLEDTYYESDDIARHSSSQPGEKPARDKPVRNLLIGIAENNRRDSIDVWLINDSRFNTLYSFLQKEDESWTTVKTGHIEPDTKILVRRYTRGQVNSFITLRLHAIFFMKGFFEPAGPSQAEYSIDPVDLFSEGALRENEFFDENAFVVPLISDQHDREIQRLREQEVNRLIGQKSEKLQSEKAKTKSKTDPGVDEVDLHISELVDNSSGLSGREALDIQMARFTTALEGALRGKTRRIVFIHGIGGGKLKFELRKALDKKYPKLRYQDASFSEYGFGATMVIIRK